MIRKLRTKFICVIMAIVMLMLAMILGVVIHFTRQNMEMQSINMMHTIAAAPFQKANPRKPPEDVRLPFFVVQVNSRGEMLLQRRQLQFVQPGGIGFIRLKFVLFSHFVHPRCCSL